MGALLASIPVFLVTVTHEGRPGLEEAPKNL